MIRSTNRLMDPESDSWIQNSLRSRFTFQRIWIETGLRNPFRIARKSERPANQLSLNSEFTSMGISIFKEFETELDNPTNRLESRIGFMNSEFTSKWIHFPGNVNRNQIQNPKSPNRIPESGGKTNNENEVAKTGSLPRQMKRREPPRFPYSSHLLSTAEIVFLPH